MKIYNNISDYKSPPKSAVSLGFFDGVHMGHKELLNKTSEIAKKENLISVAFTFCHHAGNYISGKTTVPLITDNTEKAYQISLTGIENLIFISFEDSFLTMSPEQFVRDILIEKLNAKILVCGENYTFGKNKSGNVGILFSLCEKYKLKLVVVKPVYLDGRIISSSIIRREIQKGNIERANLFLGREYSICAAVEEGKRLGREIDAPTINQSFFKDSVIPAFGVYISKTVINDFEYPSISNVGVRPTVDNQNRINIETHIIRQYFDLYDKWIKVCLIKKIRDEKKFKNTDELKAQIRKDIEVTREYFLKK